MAAAAVFLDFDDTLHDFSGAYDRAFARAAAPVCARAVGVTPAALLLRCRAPWAAVWEDFVSGRTDEQGLWAARSAAVLALAGLAPDASLSAAFHDAYRAAMDEELCLFPDAVAALDLVRATEPRPCLAILTNGPASVQRRRILHLGLAERVDFILVSGEFGVAKPDPAFFAEALRLAGVPAAAAVMIGDNPAADVGGAKASGLRAVWLDRSGAGWSGGEGGPDAISPDLLQAVRWALG